MSLLCSNARAFRTGLVDFLLFLLGRFSLSRFYVAVKAIVVNAQPIGRRRGDVGRVDDRGARGARRCFSRRAAGATLALSTARRNARPRLEARRRRTSRRSAARPEVSTMRSRSLFAVLAAAVLAPVGAALGDRDPGPRHGVVIGASEYLSAGADAIRAGNYDEGIRLTTIGLQRQARTLRDRAAGLANLCAAYVAKEEPDAAIPYCDESIELFDGNWRAYSNRSHAYLLKGMLEEAARDNAAAAALSPRAAHVQMIRGMLNERKLKPRITMQEHR